MDEKKVRITDLIQLLFRSRKLIIITILICTVTATVISLLLPVTFKAKASIIIAPHLIEFQTMPEIRIYQEQTRTWTDRLYFCMSILYSHKLAETIIEKYGLVKVYKVSNIEEAIEKFSSNLEVKMDDWGTIHISFYDTSRERAAAVTNSIVETLKLIIEEWGDDFINKRIKIISEVMDEQLKKLNILEDSLRNLQEKFNIVSVPLQIEDMIRLTNEIEIKKLQTFVQTEIQKLSQLPSNPQLYASELELKSYREMLNKIIYANEDYAFVPFAELSRSQLQYARLKVKTEIQESLYVYLNRELQSNQYIKAVLTGAVTVLDYAHPPLKSYKPNRTALIFSGFLTGIFISLIIIILKSYYEKRRFF